MDVETVCEDIITAHNYKFIAVFRSACVFLEEMKFLHRKRPEKILQHHFLLIYIYIDTAVNVILNNSLYHNEMFAILFLI